MRGVEQPHLQPGDELDGLLRKFFKSQLPQPWPAPKVPASVTSGQRRQATGRSLIRGRWALAASVALLLLGSLLLPSRFAQDAKSENNISGPGVSDRKILPERSKHHPGKANENKNNPGLGVDEREQPLDFDESDLRF
jgi:hypothetical protein